MTTDSIVVVQPNATVKHSAKILIYQNHDLYMVQAEVNQCIPVNEYQEYLALKTNVLWRITNNYGKQRPAGT